MTFRIKDAAATLGGIAMMILICLLVGVIIHGMGKVSMKLLPLAWRLGQIGLTLVIFLLLASAFPVNRSWCGIAMVNGSSAIGCAFAFWTIAALYDIWGGIGLFVGFVLLGVGAAPILAAAFLLRGQFRELFNLLLFAALVFGSRGLGVWLASRPPGRSRPRYVFGYVFGFYLLAAAALLGWFVHHGAGTVAVGWLAAWLLLALVLLSAGFGVILRKRWSTAIILGALVFSLALDVVSFVGSDAESFIEGGGEGGAAILALGWFYLSDRLPQEDKLGIGISA
jgi:hypothetical protein